MKSMAYRLAVVAMVFCWAGQASIAEAQGLVSTRGKVRVFKGGLTIEGKDLQVNDQSVSLTVSGQPTFLDLNDIDRVDVRVSNVMKGACIGGAGGRAIGLIACNAASESDLEDAGGSRGQCMAGSMIWAGLFAAGGALIGNSTSDWEPVYYRTSSSELDSEASMQLAAAPAQPRLYFAVIPPRECCPGSVGFWVRF
jgi:hypothetical protein